MSWDVVIGLEMHARLETRSKLFCGCANRYGAAANTLTCAVCAGLPGGMPVLNAAALRSAVLVALACGGRVSATCRFDRKNYFYADLPKGYQITQFDQPIGRGGILAFRFGDTEDAVALERIHLEEDAGKTMHAAGVDGSLVDLNRAGTPLLEVVTAAAFRDGARAAACLRGMRLLLRTLAVGDGDMEKGSLRCDVNVSVRRTGEVSLGTKVEVKNLNSFHAVQRAIESESARQIAVLEAGGLVDHETRLWDADQQISRRMRRKEGGADYGYLPETDLGVLHLEPAWVARVRQSLPELPQQRRQRWRRQFDMADPCRALLTEDLPAAAFFEAAAVHCDDRRRLANWMCNELPAALQAAQQTLEDTVLRPRHLGELVTLRSQRTLSQPQAKQVLERMLQTGEAPREIASRQGLLSARGSLDLQGRIDAVVAAHPEAVRSLKSGKHAVVEFLLGQVLRATSGKADAAQARQLLEKKLRDE